MPRSRLADAIWGADIPADPAGALRSCVYSLRQAIQSSERLQTAPGGYVLALHGGDALDLHTFDQLKTEGLQAARQGEHRTAAHTLQQALDLWTDPPLADFPVSTIGQGFAGKLLEQRSYVREALIDARMTLGQHRDLVTLLREFTSSEPLHERYWEQLILALYRSGNQATALKTYLQVRTILAEEYGIDPGRGLKDLHQRILASDPRLDLNQQASTYNSGARSSAAGAGQVKPCAPRTLPGMVNNFLGRRSELSELAESVEDAENKVSAGAFICAICGTAGIGKTALVLQYAHQNAQRFPDGQLYVNLHGYDSGQPMTPSDALCGLLQALGLPGRQIPRGEQERASRYRSLVAGRRMLIVLDNARDAEQVRPLLPGGASCTTLVTSRDALIGLVAREGAHRLDLSTLPLADGVRLLRELIGKRAEADPDSTVDLATRCCGLPLALRLVAELAVGRRDVPLAELAGEMGSKRQLDLLNAGGDPRSALRTVFSWSIRQLDDDTARGFRVIGMHPGPDFDRYAVAALAGTAVEWAEDVVALLVRAYLIQPAGDGRYSMHNLLRSYARELARAQDGDAEQHAAVTRLLDFYLHAAEAAYNILYPAEQYRRADVPVPEAEIPVFAGRQAARAWLAAELPSLVAAVRYTVDNDRPDYTMRLSAALARFSPAFRAFSYRTQ
jgi:DNA-binding SARP family transcriptional activator